jgi:hypothetical protein
MNTKTQKGIGATIALLAGMALFGTVRAQVFEADHLKCYQVISDTNPIGTNTVIMRTPQFNSTQRCTVQKKARFLCAETIKQRVNGQPRFNDPRGGRAEDFLCYPMTCPASPIRSVRVNDQFNGAVSRVVRIRDSLLFCPPTNKALLPTNQ